MANYAAVAEALQLAAKQTEVLREAVKVRSQGAQSSPTDVVEHISATTRPPAREQ